MPAFRISLSRLHAANTGHRRRRGEPKGIAAVSRGISIRVPKTSQGGGGRGPTAGWPGDGGGGGGRGGDDNVPSYGERLRRYRLGLMLGLSSVVMLFVSFTTAYVVRKAGAIWDPASNDYVSNWVPLTLPIRILLVDTFILLLSSVVLEFARQRAAEDVALAPIVGMPGIRVSASHALPWVWTTIVLGFGFLGRAGIRVAPAAVDQYHLRHQYQQFVLLHADRGPRATPRRRNSGAAVCRDDDVAASPAGDPPHRH